MKTCHFFTVIRCLRNTAHQFINWLWPNIKWTQQVGKRFAFSPLFVPYPHFHLYKIKNWKCSKRNLKFLRSFSNWFISLLKPTFCSATLDYFIFLLDYFKFLSFSAHIHCFLHPQKKIKNGGPVLIHFDNDLTYGLIGPNKIKKDCFRNSLMGLGGPNMLATRAFIYT